MIWSNTNSCMFPPGLQSFSPGSSTLSLRTRTLGWLATLIVLRCGCLRSFVSPWSGDVSSWDWRQLPLRSPPPLRLRGESVGRKWMEDQYRHLTQSYLQMLDAPQPNWKWKDCFPFRVWLPSEAFFSAEGSKQQAHAVPTDHRHYHTIVSNKNAVGRLEMWKLAAYGTFK